MIVSPGLRRYNRMQRRTEDENVFKHLRQRRRQKMKKSFAAALLVLSLALGAAAPAAVRAEEDRRKM